MKFTYTKIELINLFTLLLYRGQEGMNGRGVTQPPDLKLHALYHFDTFIDMKKVIIKMREVFVISVFIFEMTF